MKVLISDANVLIDMEVGGLIELMFKLPYQFHTPDILFEEELDQHHAYFLKLGLVKTAMSGEVLQQAQAFMLKHPKPSRNDCIALALARFLGAPLLTGDKHLRVATREEGVELMGTLWLFGQMIEHGLLTRKSLGVAVRKMKDGRRRLPWRKVEGMIESK
ncbi:DUF3368 domain-containing protein [bacterium]|nr:DUF3368 domain-containing protein [bacterium]